MKFSEQTLIRVIDQIAAGGSIADAAAYIGISDRMIFLWLRKSRAHNPSFLVIWNGAPGFFHMHVDKARENSKWLLDPQFADWTEDDFAIFDEPPESRFLHDDTGERIARLPEQEPELDDIEALQQVAAIEATREKARPDSPVTIFGRRVGNEPEERISGEKPELTQAEKERRNPRAHLSINADLKPPHPPAPWMKPKRLEAPGIGIQQPPAEGRFPAPGVPQRSYSVAERKAGTLSFDGVGVRRW